MLTPIVIAHRGASIAERENTVEAFARAAAMGADMVEFDVRPSRDGRLVVHHNARLADGRAIVNLDADDLPGYIPSLADALDACRPLRVNIEIKNDRQEPDFDIGDDVASGVIEVVAARGDLGRYLVSSFRLATIDVVRTGEPRIDTAWLVSEIRPDTLAKLAEHGHRTLHPWVNAVTQPLLRQCHAAGVSVNTWTCDEPSRMRELIGWGINGICTNVPDVALSVRAERA